MRASLTPYHFFLKNAGYSYGPGETPIQGRRRCAQALALAERKGTNAGLSFEWTEGDGTSADFGEPKDGGEPWALWLCACRDAAGEVVASLGGVDFGRDGSPWGDSYRRVVEAELAAEALGRLS